jgi:hypothetical protein
VGVVIAAAAVFLLTGGGSGPVDVCNTYQDCSRTLLGVAVAEC